MKNQTKNCWKNRVLTSTILAMSSTLMLATSATAATLRVKIENLAPQGGTFLTPLWVGFHNGNFDTYDRNAPLNPNFPGTESVVEDGATAEITTRFANFGAGDVQATILGNNGIPGPIDPGETATFDFDYQAVRNSGRFFSYISMVIPSNDLFIANGNPLAHPIFDEVGKFIGTEFLVLGSQVLDGGTEVNDELPQNTAFFGQQTPNTGVDENGVVRLASEFGGFLPAGSGGILDDPRFANANFLTPGYQVARITVEKVPEPAASVGLLAFAGLLLLGRGWHRQVKTKSLMKTGEL
ncbi:spondin domain-containing protein [Anabaena sp. FACHB-709]|uniref:PEP-CTERM protein-sorting domain-containing protein n=2 Tax=Nostocaceae TaxID=1162 RepID=A0A1Z4KHI6_ANAVA|nr:MULTISPECIES: spondin domain-containing protein [Nostocaceae]BAY68425.1 hypothetical protein NIES23_12110 [Trichormus variabilis NIES-23]MBD2171766.1 spondin domain-containing protein [Anabaena cylindrica FACHB-318]MBD2264284.1 spondin domain-containing protein [Anabaena sp. FACHB-709]MBD2273627.1 spondin domain-containing protein [Nostoc sp. PCC 7120 = FACHB-418]MBD2281631.1 spondin domain-containing protein [Anabaena cylindrica FACHB-170]